MLRILRENAFWDIFYETLLLLHSWLHRTRVPLRHAGFRPVDVGVAFDDQYVQLIAVLGNQSTTELSGVRIRPTRSSGFPAGLPRT